jgi:hypothetical protein
MGGFWRRLSVVSLVLAFLLGFSGSTDLMAKRKGKKRWNAKVSRSGRTGSVKHWRSKRSKRRRGKLSKQQAPATVPHIQVFADPVTPSVGETVTVTVRLMEGHGVARHAAFHVGADPAVLRYKGYRPTGRGALMVQELSQGSGEFVVYRSSLSEGFAPVETLVELEFESLLPGSGSVALVDLRLLDPRARDLGVTYEAASFQIR